MKKYVILLAAGRGNRFCNDVPKQFTLIDGVPIILHTFLNFYHLAPDIERILVLCKTDRISWENILNEHNIHIPHHIVYGGTQRFHSVKNVLDNFPFEQNSLIGIHDIVRPFVNERTITEAYDAAAIYGACAPAINAVNTIRYADGMNNNALDRRNVKVIQNPQVFKRDILLTAFQQPYEEDFFDDATVVERIGKSIHLTEGNYENIKITYPQDLYMATAILRNMQKNRVHDSL
jgi:2-C-methyl-D-erythritol 4-phosphate cytidylyltransferase